MHSFYNIVDKNKCFKSQKFHYCTIIPFDTCHEGTTPKESCVFSPLVVVVLESQLMMNHPTQVQTTPHKLCGLTSVTAKTAHIAHTTVQLDMHSHKLSQQVMHRNLPLHLGGPGDKTTTPVKINPITI